MPGAADAREGAKMFLLATVANEWRKQSPHEPQEPKSVSSHPFRLPSLTCLSWAPCFRCTSWISFTSTRSHRLISASSSSSSTGARFKRASTRPYCSSAVRLPPIGQKIFQHSPCAGTRSHWEQCAQLSQHPNWPLPPVQVGGFHPRAETLLQQSQRRLPASLGGRGCRICRQVQWEANCFRPPI